MPARRFSCDATPNHDVSGRHQRFDMHRAWKRVADGPRPPLRWGAFLPRIKLGDPRPTVLPWKPACSSNLQFPAAHAHRSPGVSPRDGAIRTGRSLAAQTAGHKERPLRAVLLGLIVMLAQLFVAVVLIAPEGPLWYRYSTLIQHDSYWFANIMDRGYDSILPPITRKMMEVSNVAFFPAYPVIAGACSRRSDSAPTRLLLTAQAAAWAFWSYFFLFAERWKLSPRAAVLRCAGDRRASDGILPDRRLLGIALSDGAARFHLLEPARRGRRRNSRGGARHRDVGEHGSWAFRARVIRSCGRCSWAAGPDCEMCGAGCRNYGGAVALTTCRDIRRVGVLHLLPPALGPLGSLHADAGGGLGCSPRLSRDFQTGSYRWLLPALENPTRWSQMTMTLGALLFVAVAVCEIAAHRRRERLAGAGGALFLRVHHLLHRGQRRGLCGDGKHAPLPVLRARADRAGFFTLSDPSSQPAESVRAFGIAAAVLLCAAGLALQGWWVWNFTRGGWVA